MKKKVPDMMMILEDLIKKSSTTSLQGSQLEHFIKIQKQLMAVIYDNKQNLPPSFQSQNQINTTTIRVLGSQKSNFAQNSNVFSSISKKMPFKLSVNKGSPENHHHSNKAKSTAILNRTIGGQLFSKSTEKYLDLGDLSNFSSLKKSEKSNAINQNLGSLIFETPPKGKQNRNYLSLHLDQANKLFDERIEISPTPFKCEEEAPNEIVRNYLSPSKFIVSRSAYKN